MKNENELKAILTMDYCSAQRELRAYHHRMVEAEKKGDESEAKACRHMWEESIGKRDYIPELAEKLGVIIFFQQLCDRVNEECDVKYGFDY